MHFIYLFLFIYNIAKSKVNNTNTIEQIGYSSIIRLICLYSGSHNRVVLSNYALIDTDTLTLDKIISTNTKSQAVLVQRFYLDSILDFR